MKPHFSSLHVLAPLAALLFAAGIAQAATPPRVMFVSGIDAQPVLIDLEGREIPAKKGAVIPPGYSLKVPDGATVQIMTEEKAILAVREGSLLKLEKLGDGDAPHVFKLDIGGLRVANSAIKPKRFEVDTPNAKVKFDKGDQEAYYFKEGKVKDRWGTFVRGFKDEAVLTTTKGDTKVTRDIVAYVPGGKLDGLVEKIPRIDSKGKIVDPVSTLSPREAMNDILANQKTLRGDPVKEKSPVELPVKTADKLVAPTTLTLARTSLTKTPIIPGVDPIAPKPIDPMVMKGQEKDILLDTTTKTAIVRTGDKFAILSRDQKLTAPPISAKELTLTTTKTTTLPTTTTGIDPGKLTKEQQVLTTTKILDQQIKILKKR